MPPAPFVHTVRRLVPYLFRLGGLLALAACCLWCSLASANPAPGSSATTGDRHWYEGVSANGALRVQGAQLVNARGLPLQLRGMSSHGIHWFPQYANRLALRQLRGLGANLFRVAMYADSSDGGYTESKEAAERNDYLLHLAVRYTLEEDMYAIVDWHILNDPNPLQHVESARRFFHETSLRYAGNPGVIYEICNEPNGDTTWDDIRAYAEQIIPVIRANAPDAVIIVGTPHFSSRVQDVQAAPLDFPNVLYAFHFYTEFENGRHQPTLENLLRQGYPIFVSEWGISGNTAQDIDKEELDKARAFVDFMRRHALSWANWSLCNKDESFSAIAGSVTTLDGWTDNDLTPSGKLVFRALGGR